MKWTHDLWACIWTWAWWLTSELPSVSPWPCTEKESHLNCRMRSGSKKVRHGNSAWPTQHHTDYPVHFATAKHNWQPISNECVDYEGWHQNSPQSLTMHSMRVTPDCRMGNDVNKSSTRRMTNTSLWFKPSSICNCNNQCQPLRSEISLSSLTTDIKLVLSPELHDSKGHAWFPEWAQAENKSSTTSYNIIGRARCPTQHRNN